MTMDLTNIDAKIRKLQKLREMLADEGIREVLADPAMMDEIRREIGGNGIGTSLLAADNQPEDMLPAEDSLRRKVLDAAIAHAGKFEAKDIVQRLKSGGWVAPRDPMIAVNSALRALEDHKWIRVVRRGSGRQPHIYEVIRREGTNK